MMGDYRPEARIIGTHIEAHGEAIGSGIENGLKAIADALRPPTPMKEGELNCPMNCHFVTPALPAFSEADQRATQVSIILDHLLDVHNGIVRRES